MIALSLIAVVYIGFVALMQKDMKKLIAYSSIAHMGFVTLGFFLLWHISRQWHGHGCSACRRHGADGLARTDLGRDVPLRWRALRPRAQPPDRRLRRCRQHDAEVCGIHGAVRDGQRRPARVPPGFVGEFMVIIASFKANFWFAFLAATTLMLGAAYTLWMVKRVVYGEVANDKVAKLARSQSA